MYQHQPDVKVVAVKGGLPIAFVLFCIFLVLKLTGHITWSWFWVAFPLFAMPLAILALVAVLLLFIWLGDVIRKVFTVPWLR